MKNELRLLLLLILVYSLIPGLFIGVAAIPVQGQAFAEAWQTMMGLVPEPNPKSFQVREIEDPDQPGSKDSGSGRCQPRIGWMPPWPEGLSGPYIGQPLPGDSPEIFAEGLISLGNHEHHLAMAPDGHEMLWVIADKYRVRHTLIRVVERDGVWLPPETAPFSGRYNDFAPSFYPDGSALLFCSNRPLPGAGEISQDSNIWKVERTDAGWGEPQPLPMPVNDGTSEYNPSIARDGTLIFQDHDEGGADLYCTRFKGGAWETPAKLPGNVNSPYAEITPFISMDGSLLIFASNRPGGFGDMDLYICRRLPEGGWSDSINMGEKVNSKAPDAVPVLSPDGEVLFFTSFRGYSAPDFLDRSYTELTRMLRSAANGDGTLYWVSARALDPSAPRWGRVPFTLDHNRMLADGEIERNDGTWRSVRLWVDTGNPRLFLSEPLARDLGIDLPDAGEGTVNGKLQVPPPQGLSVGGMPLNLEGVETFVVFEPSWLFSTMHNDANLPSTVLKRYQVVFDYPALELTLAEPGSREPKGTPVPVDVHPDTGIAQIDCVVDNESLSFALDNGASYSFTSARVLEPFSRRHPEWPAITGAIGHANIWGWGPGEPDWPVMRFPEIAAGAVRFFQVGLAGQPEYADGTDLGIWYSQKTVRPVVGFLGPNAYKAFRVEIDFPGRTIYFDQGSCPCPAEMDLVGLTVRPEADGGYSVIGVAKKDGRSAVPGIEPGDRLLQVGDLKVMGATMGKVVDALRGNPGEIRTLV
ncbi:MAG: hypothetical protein ABIK28_15430, partial [Planctomycetota bacterium]